VSDEKSKIKDLVNEVRGQVKTAETALENALQERENIIATPIPRQEVKDNFRTPDLGIKKPSSHQKLNIFKISQ
jgi:hypothetical protein